MLAILGISLVVLLAVGFLVHTVREGIKKEIDNRNKLQQELDAIPRGEIRIRPYSICNLVVSEDNPPKNLTANRSIVELALNSNLVRVSLNFNLTRTAGGNLTPHFSSNASVLIFDTKDREWIRIDSNFYSNPEIDKCIKAAQEDLAQRITTQMDISFCTTQNLINKLSDPTPTSALSRATAPNEDADTGLSLTQ